jgi:hypothetical protein
LTVAFIVAMILLGIYGSRKDAERDARILESGEPMLCYVMMANNSLHEQKKSGYSYAQVVCSPEAGIEDFPEKLAEIGKALQDYETPKNHTEDERILGSVLSSHFPSSRPLLIPTDYTDGLEAYSVSVNVYWEKLPKGFLNQQFLMYVVLLGSDGGTVMMDLAEQKKARKIRVDGFEDYDGGVPR